METDEKQPFDGWEYAGFWVRVGAAIIDTVLLILITYPLLIYFYGEQYFNVSDPDAPVAFVEGPADFLISWIFPIVAIILFWIYKSATPGKMAVHAKIVDAKTGQPPSIAQFIGRYFGYFISTLPLGIGIIWIAFDKKKQGWHDKLAGTVVIKPINPAAKIKSHSSGEES